MTDKADAITAMVMLGKTKPRSRSDLEAITYAKACIEQQAKTIARQRKILTHMKSKQENQP